MIVVYCGRKCSVSSDNNISESLLVCSSSRPTQAYCCYSLNHKPGGKQKKRYAIPIQCIPYKSLTDAKVRECANKIICQMVKRDMKISGM